MFFFSSKLSVSDEDRIWVDEGLQRLEKLPGRRRMLEARVVERTAEARSTNKRRGASLRRTAGGGCPHITHSIPSREL